MTKQQPPADAAEADAAKAAAGPLSATGRTRHRRLRAQGRRERAELFAVLRAGFIAHLGVLHDGAPMVVPTVYGFDERQLYVHGSVASNSLAAGGSLACVTITLVDGLVLARSVFEHAVNYRSAMIYARPRRQRPDGALGKPAHVVRAPRPARWDTRGDRAQELAAAGYWRCRSARRGQIRSDPPRTAGQPRCCPRAVGGRTAASRSVAAVPTLPLRRAAFRRTSGYGSLTCVPATRRPVPASHPVPSDGR
jgi:hypothetical protein